MQNFVLGEDGDPVMMENGEVVLDKKGNPVTIEHYVDDVLREQRPNYFKDPQGVNGKGGTTSVKAIDFGLGIENRKDMTPEQRSAFFRIAREKGIDNPRDRLEKIPFS